MNRIEYLLTQKNEKRTHLAEIIGVKNQSFTDWKKRGTIPAADIALKIAKHFGVSVEWLLTGEEPGDVPPDVLALAEDIARLPQEYQEIIRQNVEAYKSLCFKLERENSLAIG